MRHYGIDEAEGRGEVLQAGQRVEQPAQFSHLFLTVGAPEEVRTDPGRFGPSEAVLNEGLEPLGRWVVSLVAHVWVSHLIICDSIRMSSGSGFSPEVAQVAPQLVTGSMDIGFHRSQWNAHDFGDFFIRSALHMTQYNGRSIFGSEPPNRHLELAAQFLVLRVLLGAGRVRRHG